MKIYSEIFLIQIYLNSGGDMKDFIRSLLLISLTISALIMTGAVFMTESPEIVESTIKYDTNDLIKLIRPQNYVFSFGDLFIKIYDDSYENVPLRSEYEAVFKSFIDAPLEKKLGTSNEDTWNEQLKRKSMRVDYSFDVPLKDLLELYKYNVELNSEEIHISSVLFLLNRKDVIYIYDKQTDKYYSLSGSEPLKWIDELYVDIGQVKLDIDTYKTLEDRYALLQTGLRKYDLEQENLLLTPMALEIDYPKYNIVKEIGEGQPSNEILERYARSIFDDDLDFVKKSVYSNNEIIFIYGYGEKVFKVSGDGSLEYTVKVNENAAKEAIDFKKGLEKSLTQINKMGDTSSTLYMSGYKQIETTNAIETVYYFTYTRDGIPIYFSDMRDGHLIEIRFVNTELVKAKKNIRIAISINLVDPHFKKDFKSIMVKNKLAFELGYINDRPFTTVDAEDLYQMSQQEMSSLETKYMVVGDELIPTWHIVIADTKYIINLIDGELIKDSSN